LKHTTPALPAAAAALAAAVLFIVTTGPVNAAQQPAAQAPATPPAHHEHPAPTNLQVLPKNLTGEQVHDIMHQWEAELGANCATCHTADPNNIGPNGRPRLNYADDSKKEKATARMMFKMTDAINTQFVSKVENSGDPVTCGTCHRGHLGPQPFKPAPEDHDHDHDQPAQSTAPKQ
jgi:hypothetical protein